MVMDFSCIDILSRGKSQGQKHFPGKKVTREVIVPISMHQVSSTPDSTGEPPGVRVSLDYDQKLGEKFVVANSRVLPTDRPWANIVQPNSTQPLQFVQPIFTEGSKVIQIPPHLLAIGRQKYSLCLIGQFMGTSPKLGLIQAIAMKLWGRNGPVSVIPYSDGLYLLQFADEASLARALHGELPIEIDGCKYVIGISYSWKPQYCDECNKWGHHQIACKAKLPSTKWIPKVNVQTSIVIPADSSSSLISSSLCTTTSHSQPTIPSQNKSDAGLLSIPSAGSQPAPSMTSKDTSVQAVDNFNNHTSTASVINDL
ncbi:hypothetical protein Tsubulata_008501 [Turnera subulata]|uniref:DUF4283 domain-containing protein n=1 Tax=Turnera subulata TaxID=218843 RepID=A0A9Q0G3K5_9ROSI|nr:hypothetical protein Tsubulata_008501 [Turnera subulata]